jgi:uncharacterized protein
MRASDRYTSTGLLPRVIPVFPLGGAILLPRATLPLNIFEPRYLEMFDEAMSGSRIVGIIQPAREAGEAETSKGRTVPLRQVGCAGRVSAYQELDDGRLIVGLSGVVRFAIESEAPSGKQYRTCAVTYDTYAGDLKPGEGADDVDRDKLLSTLKRFLEARSLKADWTSIGRAANEQLVNSLSIMSPYGAEEKQALLEAVDLKARSELLVALAEMEIASAGRSGGSGSTLQ